MEDTTAEVIDPEKCETCGGKTRQDTVNLAIWSKKGLVVVEGIAAFICDQCDEQTYDDATASELRKLASADFPKDRAIRQMQVPVYSLARPGSGESK